jgi:competence protein ComGE
MNKGFFLLELLMSLAAWFLMCLFLFPLLNDLNKQSLNLEVKKQLRQLLFEELEVKEIDNQNAKNYSVIRNHIEYKIIWQDEPLSGKREVCVEVEDPVSPAKVCAIPE